MVTTQPAIAQIADIQNIQLYPTETGLNILLETEADLASQITVTSVLSRLSNSLFSF